MHETMITVAPKQRRNQAEPPLPPLRLLRTYEEGIELMEGWLKRKGSERALRILEAGCGNKWPLALDGIQYTLVGVDVDVRALEIRRASARGTDEIRYGDLRNRELFGAAQFDVIYNSFVLEHVEGAEGVLENFMYWLAPGGLLIVRIPDRDSAFGFLTRISPFWMHVLYKKMLGVKNAGKPGFDPYPTVHDLVVSRQGIHGFCRTHGAVIRDEVGHVNYLPQQPILAPLARLLVKTVSLLSLGRLDWRYNNITFAIEKKETFAGAAPVPRLCDRKTDVVAELIASRLKTPCRKLLVVGCGSGLEAAVLAQRLNVEVTGVDLIDRFDPRAVGLADLRVGDALSLPFGDRSFDVVYSYHALEHFSDPVRALREMRRVLRPGGSYCVGTPNRTRWVGYLGSQRTPWKQKLWWNLLDWKARLRGRFRNEHGAHAGFSRSELSQMLRNAFSQADDITEAYYMSLYPRHSSIISLLERTQLSSVIFPSVYFFGRTSGTGERSDS